ncbi:MULTISPECIES: glycoside hydrolase family 30 protein [Flavobacterium]|uniref:Glycoside hydrolase family 30 beta sandwich domain-containing protein n=1 Tax=Flavobacterium sedimenticola TaxID=3043286 RepID=A0ABT6XTM0_9FLAO|nr:glycoside hydrolase family 30 beta sandwich domain-containing protein [Flavobacterium sedimenticola]MDI9258448.1 glycoside hydrolase family 30 beta sandwich domain-containing protein [Flavobacterium sedimenticola]
MLKKRKIQILLFATILGILSGCAQSSEGSDDTPDPTPTVNEVDFWLTKGNGSVKLEKQNTVLAFTNTTNIYPNIEVNDNQTYQTVDGFGFTLTGGSVEVINQLGASKKQELLQELFGSSVNAIAINYLRISIGASDLNSTVFSYNDMPPGQTDVNLNNFSLAPDSQLIQMLKDILAINPTIKIMATPWSPPVWMKDNNSSIGGSLLPQYYGVYANYFVKYIQAMQAEGISIDAITPQNEPLHPGNNPSMLMLATEQANFIKNNLGPAFQSAGITTKIVTYDHNCDKPEYPLTVLSDAAANAFIDGSAFHLYAGDISALSTVHNAFPSKNIYFTEQYTASTGSFDGDLKWHLKNVIIGSMRNWSKTALEWNLANNASFGPHTPGGCTTCKGAITITGNFSYEKNVGFYIVGHASKFVPTGSVRIASTQSGSLNTVAFKTPNGKKVLIVENDGTAPSVFNIKYNGKWTPVSLEGGSVGTFIW